MLKIWNEHSSFDQMSLSSLDSLWLVLNVRTRINRKMVEDYKSGAFLNFFENSIKVGEGRFTVKFTASIFVS